jgi:WD40 repeat protein
LATSSGAGPIRLWNLRNFSCVQTLKEGGESSWPHLDFSPDSQTVAAGFPQGIVKLLDITGSRPTTALSIGPGHAHAIFLQDGKSLAAVSGEDFTLWDVPSRQCTVRDKLGSQLVCLAATSRDLLAVIGGRYLGSWSPEERCWFTYATNESGCFSCAAASVQGKTVACGDSHGIITLYEIGATHPRASLAAHRTAVKSLAFSPDGKVLASAGADGTVQLWHVATAQKLFTLVELPGKDVGKVTFSPNGQMLAVTMNAPGQVAIWSTSVDRHRAVQ